MTEHRRVAGFYESELTVLYEGIYVNAIWIVVCQTYPIAKRQDAIPDSFGADSYQLLHYWVSFSLHIAYVRKKKKNSSYTVLRKQWIQLPLR